MIEIRLMRTADIEQVSRLHQKNLESPGSKIGLPYLRILYEVLLTSSKRDICLVACEGNEIIGSVGATVDLTATNEQLLRRLISRKVIMAVTFAVLSLRLSIFELLARVWVERRVIAKFGKSYPTIMTLFVDNPNRRMKVGEKLLVKLFERLKELKIAKIYTDTYKVNTSALAFYKKQGFEVIDEILDCVVLERKL